MIITITTRKTIRSKKRRSENRPVMSINHISLQKNDSSGHGCLIVFLCVIGIIIASSQLFFVAGFWLRCGMFLTIFAGCVIGGIIGLKIGTSVGRVVSPESVWTQNGFWELLRIKLFWFWCPSLLGMLFGSALGVHLFLMIFWGLPITSLGRGQISFIKTEKQDRKSVV